MNVDSERNVSRRSEDFERRCELNEQRIGRVEQHLRLVSSGAGRGANLSTVREVVGYPVACSNVEQNATGPTFIGDDSGGGGSESGQIDPPSGSEGSVGGEVVPGECEQLRSGGLTYSSGLRETGSASPVIHRGGGRLPDDRASAQFGGDAIRVTGPDVAEYLEWYRNRASYKAVQKEVAEEILEESAKVVEEEEEKKPKRKVVAKKLVRSIVKAPKSFLDAIEPRYRIDMVHTDSKAHTTIRK
jgi:hypothetical protein